MSALEPQRSSRPLDKSQHTRQAGQQAQSRSAKLPRLPANLIEGGDAMYTATTSPSGSVNNIKVKCSACSASLYVNPNYASASGGWECPHCKKRH
jgi:DNA-directed RNA polymerase subunit RPC12/RpoP